MLWGGVRDKIFCGLFVRCFVNVNVWFVEWGFCVELYLLGFSMLLIENEEEFKFDFMIFKVSLRFYWRWFRKVLLKVSFGDKGERGCCFLFLF